MKFFIINIKKVIIPFIFCVFTICLIIFSKTNLTATKSGLELWATSVLPSLLPFFIAVELLKYTDIIKILGKLFNPIMRPIFNVPGAASFALIMGIISGYPTGAKIVSDFKKEGICSDIECERLIAFTNNSGPLFIISTVGISFLGDTRTGILLFITHILACLSVGFLFRWWKNGKKSNYSNNSNLLSQPKKNNKKANLNNLGEILATSIMNSINTIIMIGGFVTIFSVIVSILKESQILNTFSILFEPFFKNFNINSSYISRNNYWNYRTYKWNKTNKSDSKQINIS